jgi:hypothetical protein
VADGASGRVQRAAAGSTVKAEVCGVRWRVRGPEGQADLLEALQRPSLRAVASGGVAGEAAAEVRALQSRAKESRQPNRKLTLRTRTLFALALAASCARRLVGVLWGFGRNSGCRASGTIIPALCDSCCELFLPRRRRTPRYAASLRNEFGGNDPEGGCKPGTSMDSHPAIESRVSFPRVVAGVATSALPRARPCPPPAG